MKRGIGRYVRMQGVTRGNMSENTAVDTIAGLDYEEIEAAVMETARGRWFLTEFARRQRGTDTRILLDAIRRLEDQLLSMSAPISAPVENPLLAKTEGSASAVNCMPDAQPRLAQPEPSPATGPARQATEPAMAAAPQNPVAAKAKAPAFVPSDDDLFEADDAGTKPAPVARNPIPPSALGSDTLNFSNIEVPPLPDTIPDEQDSEVAATAPTAPTAPGAPDTASTDPGDAASSELKARDRVIQVTRSGSRMSPPPGPRTAMPGYGRSNTASPAAVNAAVASNPASAVPHSSGSGSSSDGKSKRIIVIRRPADSTDGIPLAGDSFDGNGPGAA